MLRAMSLPREQVCKGCSLVVQPGYPKCPRCKMPLPKFEAPLATVTKAGQVKGGTSIEEEESGSGMMLVAGGVALVALIGVVLVVRKDDPKPTLDRRDQVRERRGQERDVAPRPNDDSQIGISTEPEELSPEQQRRAALAELGQSLSEARLWATVGLDPSAEGIISIVSSACEQDEMQPTLLASAAALKEVGFSAIRCVAKAGAQVFELPL